MSEEIITNAKFATINMPALILKAFGDDADKYMKLATRRQASKWRNQKGIVYKTLHHTA